MKIKGNLFFFVPFVVDFVIESHNNAAAENQIVRGAPIGQREQYRQGAETCVHYGCAIS